MAERGRLELRFLSVPVPVEFNMKHRIAALFVALAVGSASAQNTWFVDVAGQPPGNGTALSPYTSIQSAIDAPSTLAGDTVQVASGVYMESVNFRGKSLRVIGAGASTTTIDASGRNSAAVLMVSSENSTTVLKGFTIQGGQGNSTSGGYGLGQGGGVLCVGASPRLEELVIRNNQASHGGGIQLYNGANATIRHCEVYNNYAQPDGGGIYVRGCHSPVIEDSIVRDNSSSTWGGGFYFSDDVDAQISRTLVVRNSSGTGGAFVLQSDCDPVLTNVTIADNSAGFGAGFFLYHAGWPPNNPVLLNSIVWNNLPTEVQIWGGSASGSVSAAYTDFRGGIGGVGNINVDPAFTAPAAGDYTLSVGSPCIDAGAPASPADPDGSRADMGVIPHQVVVQPLLPQAYRKAFVAAQVVDLERKRSEALAVVHAASAAAGAAAIANPFPLSDALLITPIQMAMVAKLALLYGDSGDALKAQVLPMVATTLGKLMASSLAKLIPIFGQIVNAGVAAALTEAMGHSLIRYLSARTEARLSGSSLPSLSDFIRPEDLEHAAERARDR